MKKTTIPSGIVEIKKNGWSKGTGYVILSEETGLIIHYLSEWNCFLYRDEGGSVTTPIKPYKEFVRTAYAENQEAVSRILEAAKEGPLKNLDDLRNEFNSLLPPGQLTDKTIKEYASRVEEILRR